MAPKSKQAERNAQRRAAKKTEDPEPEPVATKGSMSALVDLGKTLVLGSCLVKLGPKMPDLLKSDKDGQPAKKEEKAEPAEKTEDEQKPEGETEGNDAPVANGVENDDTPASIFGVLSTRLAWHNCLGLATPASGPDAVAKWQVMKSLELDWGPRKARRGNPSLDRIIMNFCSFLPQYLHLLLALMMLRAFVFRSYFACLPWLVGYQLASLLVPTEMLPQVPLKFRVAATLAINALLWLFFLYEVVWKMWFFEKFFYFGLLVFHAHSVRPVGA
eukprot:TRINITY_DN987_c0_g1_i1.p1 TRINITY_DN987_c0_g1~~TRINITY_DN987_c0_g1_i1.p1  ORF type:complete len:273 (+),score=74.25 TRINITY_DN987_c0_g1_i1:71-889(+)